MNQIIYDQAYLQKRRAELQAELDKSRAIIAHHASSLLTPSPATNSMQYWMGQAQRAVAVYDGVMTGYKLLKKFRSFCGVKSKSATKRKS